MIVGAVNTLLRGYATLPELHRLCAAAMAAQQQSIQRPAPAALGEHGKQHQAQHQRHLEALARVGVDLVPAGPAQVEMHGVDGHPGDVEQAQRGQAAAQAQRQGRAQQQLAPAGGQPVEVGTEQAVGKGEMLAR